jgi:hypothetical protein
MNNIKQNVMNSILNNKKNRLFSLVMVLASMISVGIFIQSCSNEDEYTYNSSNNSKLELLVTSPEYKDLNGNILNFGYALKSNYSELSDIGKDKVITILNEINSKSNSQEELDKLFEEFNSIMKIDFKAITNKINDDVVRLNLYREINGISDREFTLAVNKYPNNSNIPRLKNGLEYNNNTADCIVTCSAIATVCFAACTGPQALAGCHALCLAIYAACCLTC